MRKVKIACRDVTHTYTSVAGGLTHTLNHVNIDNYEAELLCLVGPSGCGKSTLLNIVAGLLKPTSGVVQIDGRDIAGPGPDRAVVFQSDAVFPWYTVEQNLEFGPKCKGLPKEERRRIVQRFLKLVALEGQERRYPKELSGGMRKRVDLARAYANDPEVLLMDEPFGALDAMTKEKMQVELVALRQVSPKTIIFVTHDLEEALFLADRVIVMTARPARIAAEIEVPFPAPRSADVRTDVRFQQLRRELREVFAQAERQGQGAAGA